MKAGSPVEEAPSSQETDYRLHRPMIWSSLEETRALRVYLMA